MAPPLLPRRSWMRVLVAFVIVVFLVTVIVPQAYVGWWRAQNPAPLGRSARAIDSAIANALSVGTSRDSAARFLSHYALGYSTDSGVTGRVIIAIARNVDTDGIIITSVRVRLEFDPTWRLTSRATEAVFTGP